MRGAIARNMTLGWQAPRVAMTVEVDMSACLGQQVGVTPQVLSAVAGALRDHPALNAWLTPEGIAPQSVVNLGMAVALAEGLAVPVIRNAAARSLADMAQQVRELAAAARQQSLPPKAYQGGSFTVTNLGATGIDWFTPILNPPQVGILGIGRTLDTPVVRDGQIVIAPMMSMTLVFDHRAVDGHPAALFLADLRKRLEAGEQRWIEQQLSTRVTQPITRFWRYTEPALVLGCGQRASLAQLPDSPIPALVRHAGGGAVLTGPWMLSLSVMLPPDHPAVSSGILSSYRWLGESLATALQNSWGVPAQALAKHASKPPHWACFAGLSPWEVVADGRKLVGLAQVRRSTGVLLTAGVLVSPPDWALLCHAMGKPLTDAMDLECATTSVSAYGGHAVTAHDVFPALALARRSFLAGAAGMSVVPVTALSMAPTALHAASFKVLGSQTGATLLRMARDIYPHDKLADRYYLQALMAHEKASAKDAALKKMITDGVAELDAQAKRRFGSSYAATPKEADRVSVLKAMEQSPFFQKIRGDMVTGLYDNKQVWPMLGYEGSSWQKGGYVNRGFNDINWL
eukprot:gene1408-1380_t